MLKFVEKEMKKSFLLVNFLTSIISKILMQSNKYNIINKMLKLNFII